MQLRMVLLVATVPAKKQSPSRLQCCLAVQLQADRQQRHQMCLRRRSATSADSVFTLACAPRLALPQGGALLAVQGQMMTMLMTTTLN